MYIFDTSAFIVLKHYYRQSFPSLWTGLEQLIHDGVLVSTREVYNELRSYNDADYIQTWADDHKEIFATPSNDELEFVAEIFWIPHFQALISQKAALKGTPVADPFIVAAAAIKNAVVITQESLKPNAAKIPNVCEHFGIRCIKLEDFMTEQNWNF
jgi:hypothetical protein